MVGLQLPVVEVGPKVAVVGTFVQTWEASLVVEDVGAVAGEGTWRRQEDAVIQSAGTGACVVGNAKGAVAVEDEGEWEDEQLKGESEIVVVEVQLEVHRLALEKWQAFVLKSLNPQFCLIIGLERGHMQAAVA